MKEPVLDSLLYTDFYQLSMAWAYMLSGNKANELTGFEAFCRNIKSGVSGPNLDFYVFGGHKAVVSFVSKVKKEIATDEFREAFIDLVSPKVAPELRDVQVAEIRERWKTLPKSFKFQVYPEGKKVVPHIPVFQYQGPRWIGQLLETPILNLINGATGYNTQKHWDGSNSDKMMILEAIVYPEQNTDDLYMNHHIAFQTELAKRAREYRSATSTILLEAGFRRAPSFATSLFASGEALHKNWDGTSNVSSISVLGTDSSKVGGTMAHAFVMSFATELESFLAWDKVFPKSTILIDTYDVLGATRTLIKNNIRPKDVRIDSDPLDEYAFEVRELLDEAGWTEVEIFLSGDLTPEILRDYHDREVPFYKCMAGSKYLNNGYGEMCNCGFVYKIVEYVNENGETVYPQKKSTGKMNYPGLKRFDYVSSDNTMIVSLSGLWDTMDSLEDSDFDTRFVVTNQLRENEL
jgi:nicotinate phosphoribosyltransferase